MKFLLLHLSDIHLKETNNPVSERIDALAAASASAGAVDSCVIVISGDVAYSGKESEYYDVAFDLLSSLQSQLQERLRLRDIPFVLVPGNHDCALKPANSVRNTVIESLQQKPEQANDPLIINACTVVQEKFFEFASTLTKSTNDTPRIHYEELFQNQDRTVRFQCLNTAWVSQIPENQGGMIFPIEVLPTTGMGEADLVVTVMHHPYNWFRNENGRALREWVESTSDIILTGHEHVSDRYEKMREVGTSNEYLESGALQDSYDRAQSSFSTLLVDLERKKQQHYHYQWQGERYMRTASSDESWMPLQINQLREQRGFTLRTSFRDDLDDPGASFTNAHGDVKLSDVFIHPQVQELQQLGSSKARFSAVQLSEKLHSEPLLLIDGPDRAGKTSLAKQLFLDLKAQGSVPVLLDGAKLDDHRKAVKALERMFVKQYEADLDAYRQVDKSEKVLLIDDFHLSKLNAKGKSQLIRALHEQCGKIVLFAQNLSLYMEEIVSDETTTLLESFYTLRLLEFGYELRDKLVDRWMRPEDDYFEDAMTLANKVRKTKETVNLVLGRNFIPSYPFFILSVLQIMQSNTPLDTSSTSYGQGYFYEALALKQINQVTNDLDPSTKITYLSVLAYHFYKTQKRELTYDELKAVHERYCTEYKRNLDLDKLSDEFQRALILKVEPHAVRFRYGYLYCYFVAKYLAVCLEDGVAEQEVRQVIEALSKRVYKEEAANILLFLTHLSKDRFIIDTMLTDSRQLYADFEPANLEEDVDIFNALLNRVPELYYDNADPEEVHASVAKEIDEITDLSGEEVEEVGAAEEEDEQLILELNKAQKTLQILGQVLKNEPGAIRGERKLEIAREVYDLGLRVVAGINHLLEKHFETLVEDLTQLVLSRNPEKDKSEVVSKVQRLLTGISRYFSCYMIKSVTHAVGSEKLEETFKDLHNERGNTATSLIDTSIRLDHLAGYPIEQVKSLKASIDEQKNYYAMGILQQIVLSNLQLFHHPVHMRQKACEAVDVKFREGERGRVLPKPSKR